MSKLNAAKLIAEIAHLGAQVFGIVADKDLARKNQERDDKIRELERQLAETCLVW